jgi:hypothetical protein
MKKIIRLTESDLARIVRRVIKENADKTNIYYRRCEGGYGLIEPESFEFLPGDDKFIKFLRKPDPNFDNGNSKSIGKCLAYEEPMEGLCFDIIVEEGEGGRKIAYSPIDCETRERW